MEKLKLGLAMSNHWTSPPIAISFLLLVAPPLAVISFLWIASFSLGTAVCCALGTGAVLAYLSKPQAGNSGKYLRFTDAAFKAAWLGKKIPICTLVEGYLDEKFDFVDGDVIGALNHRKEFISWFITFSDAKFLLKQFIPGISSSFYDKKTCKREIADHYDRHTDFFGAFMGPSMVYTCAMFKDYQKESLEDAQNRKLDTICEKMHVKPGHKHLDIGCGWGTLVRRSEKEHGAITTGVTLSNEGAKWCMTKNKEEDAKGKILEMDYRDIPFQRFNAISAIEMAEHVGLGNFNSFLHQVKKMLEDDGVFLMQVAGLRQGAGWEDISWGLFMSRYIFPGADASTPLNWYVYQLEKAGFEVRSVETIGKNYSHTLHHWYKNFMKNCPKLDKKAYPERLIRLWKIFLAWSTIASGQGTATCYQLVSHKNTSSFDRNVFVGTNVYGKKV